VNDRAQRQGVIEVHNPFTRELVGTVPKASVTDVKRAFETAHAFKPTFTRYQRAQLLEKAAALLRLPRRPRT
jgi:acyl-CoA reductase-like NAD-dependent aldehyde dehydrogenase